jgi:hypothetical protein
MRDKRSLCAQRDLIPALRRPINRRLFGENKTWRGAVVMTGGTVAATLALYRLPSYRRRLPQPVADANPVLLGTLLGGACWLGELPNSFLKRRLGIAPGERRRSQAGVAISIFDQADWVPVAWLFLVPIWKLRVREVAGVFVVVAAIHVTPGLTRTASSGVRSTSSSSSLTRPEPAKTT